MKARKRTVQICAGLAIPFVGFIGCSESPAKSQSATGVQDGKSTSNSPACASVVVSNVDEQEVRERVHSHLTVLLSRPSFRVLGWEGERVELSEVPNYRVMTGRLTLINVFQEEATHEFAALHLPPNELIRLSLDGESIWGKPFENLSQAVQATTSPEEYDVAYGAFSAQHEAGSGPARTVPGDEASGRIWTDRTGRYVVRGKLLGRTPSGLIRLEKDTGKVIHVAESELSPDDRTWIKENETGQPATSE